VPARLLKHVPISVKFGIRALNPQTTGHFERLEAS
jgi:hypothetical protein